jgi:nitrite reductase/ring-hydroxylating ferredoxin subunit
MTTSVKPRPAVELGHDNPTRRMGEPMPREGANGVFSEGWYPICMSSEVAAGQVRGEAFLDGKVVVFRGADGVARVMSAYCPHVGADLSVGQVVGDGLRCAFHKWEFDGQGACLRTAIGDPPPAWARLYRFPTAERYGVVWAHNGETPLWQIPDFEFADDELSFHVFRYEPIACDPWVAAANTPDMQHLKAVHGVAFKGEDPHALVQWEDWGFRYRIVAEHQNGVPIEWELSIHGTSLFQQQGPFGDMWLGAIAGLGLPRPGQCAVFVIQALQKPSGPDAKRILEERLEKAVFLMRRTIDGEDMAILNSIHYRPGALTKGDATLGAYLNFVRRYPRAHPSAEFIR